jgi:hypothetical protein
VSIGDDGGFKSAISFLCDDWKDGHGFEYREGLIF